MTTALLDTGTTSDVNIVSTTLELGNTYLSNSSTGIISGGVDFGTGTDSSVLIRANANGRLYHGDVEDYIKKVNSKEIQNYFNYDPRVDHYTRVSNDTSITGTGYSTGTGTGFVSNNITSTNIYSYINNNEVTWHTDKGIINTIVGTDGTMRVVDPKKLETERRREAKRQGLKSNLTIITRSRASYIPSNIPANEQIAIDTLREEITEKDFRRYIKHGFVLVKGASGDTYQIFRNRSHTKVWRGGKVIEEICVRIHDRSIPPTDNVIAFKNIIQFSEEEFKKMGNVYRMDRSRVRIA